MKKFKLTTFHVILPIIIGGLIYVSFRSSSLKMFEWLAYIGTNDLVCWFRNMIMPIKDKVPSWIYFSLPDGLWVYSSTSALLILWNSRINLWIFIPLFTSIVIEIAQKTKIVSGTFDILDLSFSILGVLLSNLIITHNFKCK